MAGGQVTMVKQMLANCNPYQREATVAQAQAIMTQLYSEGDLWPLSHCCLSHCWLSHCCLSHCSLTLLSLTLLSLTLLSLTLLSLSLLSLTLLSLTLLSLTLILHSIGTHLRSIHVKVTCATIQFVKSLGIDRITEQIERETTRMREEEQAE